MTPSINDLNFVAQTTSVNDLTSRQRIEKVLAQLPYSDGQASLAQVTGGAIDATSFEELLEPVQRVNDVMRSYGIEFDLQRQEGRVVTRIVDRLNGDVIRQLPSEEVLRIADSLEQIRGRLITLEA
ncbi:flagellar protein FlaG [Halomonas sp. PR-M31]|uniref:flagellar protein FlaG n=1 Tax=Halomonas sp. PR-M31 TaxID=1471202 RepID=UPI000651A339|nr:flagellar protein FlaG [Halomonas sp. PR-M31]